MPNNKEYFIEIVRDRLGDYYANVTIDGELIRGLPEFVNFITLRKAIKEKTGIEIPYCKDLIFVRSFGKSYAHIENGVVKKFA